MSERPKIEVEIGTWICDPKKNTGCSKTGCMANPEKKYPMCYATKNIENAKLDEGGEPIIATLNIGRIWFTRCGVEERFMEDYGMFLNDGPVFNKTDE